MCREFFSTLKKECIYRKSYATIEEIRHDVFEYIELFYNRKRIHSVLVSVKFNALQHVEDKIEDKNGRCVHFHGADDSIGNPFEKGKYHQEKGHFLEDIRGYRDNKK